MSRSNKIMAFIIALLPFISNLALGKPNTGWIEYKSSEGRFSILMPNQPKIENTKIDNETLYQFVCWEEDLSIAFSVNYTDYPSESIEYYGANAIYEHAINGSVKGVKGKLDHSNDFILDNYYGKEVVYQYLYSGVPYIIKDRLLLVGKRLYAVKIVTSGKIFLEELTIINTFFDSFKVSQVFARQPEWKSFSCEEGGFSALFPGVPKEEKVQSTLSQSWGFINGKTFIVHAILEDYEEFYMIEYCDYPEEFVASTSVDDILNTFQDLTLKRLKLKLIASENVIYENFKARDLKVQSKEVSYLFNMRFFMNKNRAYIIMAISNDNRNISRFFSSLKLYEK